MQEIKPVPLTRKAFAPFGDVIETAGADHFEINNGSTTRFHDLAKVQTLGDNARSMISIFRGCGFTLPLNIRMMERHPLGSQAFIPLNQRPFLVVVAQDNNGVPTIPTAFLASANQGINYCANIWHHPLIALEEEADFLVVDRGGDGDNLEEYFYDLPFEISD